MQGKKKHATAIPIVRRRLRTRHGPDESADRNRPPRNRARNAPSELRIGNGTAFAYPNTGEPKRSPDSPLIRSGDNPVEKTERPEKKAAGNDDTNPPDRSSRPRPFQTKVKKERTRPNRPYPQHNTALRPRRSGRCMRPSGNISGRANRRASCSRCRYRLRRRRR